MTTPPTPIAGVFASAVVKIPSRGEPRTDRQSLIAWLLTLPDDMPLHVLTPMSTHELRVVTDYCHGMPTDHPGRRGAFGQLARMVKYSTQAFDDDSPPPFRTSKPSLRGGMHVDDGGVPRCVSADCTATVDDGLWLVPGLARPMCAPHLREAGAAVELVEGGPPGGLVGGNGHCPACDEELLEADAVEYCGDALHKVCADRDRAEMLRLIKLRGGSLADLAGKSPLELAEIAADLARAAPATPVPPRGPFFCIVCEQPVLAADERVRYQNRLAHKACADDDSGAAELDHAAAQDEEAEALVAEIDSLIDDAVDMQAPEAGELGGPDAVMDMLDVRHVLDADGNVVKCAACGNAMLETAYVMRSGRGDAGPRYWHDFCDPQRPADNDELPSPPDFVRTPIFEPPPAEQPDRSARIRRAVAAKRPTPGAPRELLNECPHCEEPIYRDEIASGVACVGVMVPGVWWHRDCDAQASAKPCPANACKLPAGHEPPHVSEAGSTWGHDVEATLVPPDRIGAVSIDDTPLEAPAGDDNEEADDGR